MTTLGELLTAYQQYGPDVPVVLTFSCDGGCDARYSDVAIEHHEFAYSSRLSLEYENGRVVLTAAYTGGTA